MPADGVVPCGANSYPSDVRLREPERPLDVLDDRACRAVAGLRSVVLVAGEVGETVLVRALVEPGVGEDVAAVGDVRLAELAPRVGPLRDVAGESGAPVTDLLRGSAATSVGQFWRRRPGWDEEPP